MMTPRKRHLVVQAGGPGATNQRVLAMELGTFVCTNGSHHRYSQPRLITDRAEFTCASAIQLNIVLEKRCLCQWFKVIEATDTYDAMHHIGRKRGCLLYTSDA